MLRRELGASVIVGVFPLRSSPFKHVDNKTVGLMHLVLRTEDGSKEILIPSGNVATQTVQKKKVRLPRVSASANDTG